MPEHSSLLALVVAVPAVFSVLALIRPVRRALSLGAALLTFYIAIRIFLVARSTPIAFDLFYLNDLVFSFYADTLSSFILLACSFFAVLFLLYSPRVLDDYAGNKPYPFYFLLTFAAANGVAISHNLFMLIFFWGFLAATLYAILLISRTDPAAAAQKAFLIIGVSDVFLLLGFIILFVGFDTRSVILKQQIGLNNSTAIFAFILLLIGVLAKTGSLPFHSWIPEAARVAPAPTMALLPGSFDKLLGIYLMIRMTYYIFDLSSSVTLQILLMTIGAVAIVAMAIMAILQKDALRLLAFSTVSQAGYMILGIGTGIPVAIAGGLFHMLNNTVYKSALFLSAGSVEFRARSTDLDRLGGLGTKMPLTFFSFIIAALAISGVPPLSGFYSKWMIYQGIIELSRITNLWPIFLIAAMIGSVLTLAYSLKITYALFLGERPKELDHVRETNFDMFIPTVILALGCIVFGILAVPIPLRFFIVPSLPFHIGTSGVWTPGLAFILIIVGLGLGFILFLLGTATRPKKSEVFVGGEVLKGEEARIPGTEFYSSIKFLKHLPHLYEKGESGLYDLYQLLLKIIGDAALIIFKYVDRAIDQLNNIIAEVVQFAGTTLKSLVMWYILLLAIPLFGYAASGTRSNLQIFALLLLIGGPLIALVEDHLYKFLAAIATGQLGLILLSLTAGEKSGNAVALFQCFNSIIALWMVIIGIKTATRLANRCAIPEMSGLIKNAGITSTGFIIGGLMLSALPPSVNFLGKYLISSLYGGNTLIIHFVALAALLNLAAFLRVIRKVFLGPPSCPVRKKLGLEEVFVVVFIIISLLLTTQAGNLIKLYSASGGLQ